MKHSSIRIGTLLLALGLCACAATPVYEGRLRWSDGWREGVVDKIEQSDQIVRTYLLSCGSRSSKSFEKKLVQIHWNQVGRQRKWIVAIPKDSTLSLGDPVFVNVMSCTEGVVVRTATKPSRQKN